MEAAMQNASHDPQVLPDNLPVPQDDGAADHLTGMKCADVSLPATDRTRVNLSGLPGRTVVYAYPRTGVPGQDMPEGWDAIPGARGCTPQSCAFRDHFAELTALGVTHVHGLSTQSTAYQREAAERLHLPFSLLSDEKLAFATAMRLPVFEVEGMTLLKRLALVIDNGVIKKVFYPVFPPDRNAADVIAWLSSK
jgi:peroxiredoxin